MSKITNLKQKLLITAAVLAYTLIVYLTHLTCPFLSVFGIPCPGCGMTRAIILAVQLKLREAFLMHMMFWCVPVLYACFLLDGKLFKRRWMNTAFYIIISAGFLINWMFALLF